MFGRLLKFLHFGETPSAKAGRLGEDAAAKFLAQKMSMKILSRNYRYGRYEIDIIALDSDCLVFVEVKTRSENAIVDGYYSAVSKRKMAALRKCAAGYIASLVSKPKTWRFDAVDVRRNRDGKIVSISHFPNVG